MGAAIDSHSRFATRVPDVADYAAAELATAALNSDHQKANQLLKRLTAIDTVLESAGDKPTGLVPVATDLVNATMDAPRAYRNATRALLHRDDLDPALRERLSRSERDDPLELANERIFDARMLDVARAFNTIAEPVGKSIMNLSLGPYRLARSVLAYALAVHQQETLPLQRRQALAHWKEFVARYPDAPESRELRVRIERGDVRLNETLRDRVVKAAEHALEVDQARLALVYAERALTHVPEDPEATAIRNEAEARILQLRENQQRAVSAPQDPGPLSAETRAVAIALLDPDADLQAVVREHLEDAADPQLDDEVRFIRALASAQNGGEIAKWDTFESLAERDPADSNMGRHAAAELKSPRTHPYRAFTIARNLDRQHRAMWVFFGQWSKGARDHQLPRPLEWLIDLPSIAQTIVAAPLRALQVGFMDTLPAARMAAVYARRYLDMHPQGERADEVREWLSDHEQDRENWIAVYHIAQRNPGSDPDEVAELREKAAKQALRFARREKRADLRNNMYRHVAQEYTDSRAGYLAGQLAAEELEQRTPQRVRVSRGFLEENPDFAGAQGLGLDPHLLDGNGANGELHPAGVVLLGGRQLELHFLAPSGNEDDLPTIVYQSVSEKRFARLIAKLEETSFRNALVDRDERIVPDASRDVFFERARVGLSDEIDSRALAGSDFAYRGMRERYGMVRARESVLPFDLVISGSLSDLSLGAFPRLRDPEETPDAFLFR